MSTPVIFLSAVSAEFRELRQLLHDAFKTHFHVITQDDTLHPFPGGDVRQLLSDAIERSHAVLHLAGAGFGSTAAAPFPEMPGFLCSWTQYEYYYAHSFDADPPRNPAGEGNPKTHRKARQAGRNDPERHAPSPC